MLFCDGEVVHHGCGAFHCKIANVSTGIHIHNTLYLVSGSKFYWIKLCCGCIVAKQPNDVK